MTEEGLSTVVVKEGKNETQRNQTQVNLLIIQL